MAVLASVVNENGIFQIGDRVFRVTYDKAFEAPVSSIAQLALDNPEGAPGVITHEVERRPLNQHNFTIKTCNNNYQYGGLKRFRGEMLFNNYPWGQFLGIRVRHQAKGIGWFAYNASTLHMNFNGQITVNGNIAYDGNYSCGYRSNAATFTHLLYYCSSSMSPCYITLAVNVNYAGRGIDGVWRSCATN